MGGPRLSSTARGWIGIPLVALTAVTVTVLLHRARFERTLLALTETRLAFAAADVGARIQSGLDLGLDLPAMANVQAILDAETRDDPKILAVEVLDAAGKILFRAGPAAAGARPGGPGEAAAGGEGDRAAGPGDAADAEAGVGDDRRRAGDVVWSDAGSGLIAGRSGLVDIFGEPAGTLVLSYSRSSVAATTAAMTFLLARVALVLVLLLALAGLAWLWARAAPRDPPPARGPATPDVAGEAPAPGSPAPPGREPAATGLRP